MMKLLCLFAVLLPFVAARRAFPIHTDIVVENLFQRTNANLEYDNHNFLVDEAGPYAICENVEKNGGLPIVQKPEYQDKFGNNRVSGLIGTTRTTSVTRSGAKADINTIVNEWVRVRRGSGRNEFIDQINNANLFGCAVEPGCRHNYRREGREQREVYDTTTIVVCLFSRV